MRRRCTECHKIITSGFMIHDGDEYYCSTTCLRCNYTPNEWREMYESEQGYWTDWEDDE